MMKEMVLVALAVLIPSCLGSLIVGGKESTPHSRPYQVAIMNSAKGQYCGGTLVHPYWVVTAAHCSSGDGTITYVGLGYHEIKQHNGPNQQFIRGTWRVHPDFNTPVALDNDIALIQLDKTVATNSDVEFIRIISTPPPVGMPLLVSGWGNRDPTTWNPPTALHEVVVYADTKERCVGAYGGSITDNMFCASITGGGKDACQGDSGGPVVSNFADNYHHSGVRLEGIVSWGYGCAEAAHPGVYTKISKYCSWMFYMTNGGIYCT